MDWVENSMGYPVNQAFNIFGQIYFPAEKNIHICKVPRALGRTVKLTINEMGGIYHWLDGRYGSASTKTFRSFSCFKVR